MTRTFTRIGTIGEVTFWYLVLCQDYPEQKLSGSAFFCMFPNWIDVDPGHVVILATPNTVSARVCEQNDGSKITLTRIT